jgi:hypothetical protein
MSRNNIIESLFQNRISEAGTPSVWTSVTLKVGDKVKFMDNSYGLKGKILWVASIPSSKDNPLQNYTFLKSDKSGKMRDLNMATFSRDTVRISVSDMERMLTRKFAVVLSDTDSVDTGELTVQMLKNLLQDVGIDTITGSPLDKLVKGQGSHLRIDLGTGSKNIDLIISKIQDVLKKNNITYEKENKYGEYYAVYIPKMQGDMK